MSYPCPACARPHVATPDARRTVVDARAATLQPGDFLLGSRGTILAADGRGGVTVARRNDRIDRAGWNPRTTMRVCREVGA